MLFEIVWKWGGWHSDFFKKIVELELKKLQDGLIWLFGELGIVDPWIMLLFISTLFYLSELFGYSLIELFAFTSVVYVLALIKLIVFFLGFK